MSVTYAAGMPDYTESGSYNYIPKLFAQGTRVKYYEQAVVTGISNTKYEGMIRDKGDEVVIRTRPDVTISNYEKGSTFNYETLASDSISLTIDYAKKYAFKIDDVDAKQADIVLDSEFIADAGHKMSEEVDEVVLQNIYSSADSSNQGSTAGVTSSSYDMGVSGTPRVLTKDNVMDFFVDCKCVLNEQFVTKMNRWMVLPTWVFGLIDKSDLQNVSFSGDDKSLLYKEAYVGNLCGFKLFESSKLNSQTDGVYTAYDIVFGHKDALTFAGQLVKNESVKLESTFGTGYRGLNVFGFKVVVPKAMGWGYIAQG